VLCVRGLWNSGGLNVRGLWGMRELSCNAALRGLCRRVRGLAPVMCTRVCVYTYMFIYICDVHTYVCIEMCVEKDIYHIHIYVYTHVHTNINVY